GRGAPRPSRSMMTDDAVERRARLMPGMALDAPAHRQGRDLRHPLHPLDRPVTLLAGQAGRDVPLVGEVDVARHLVDPDPRDRLLLVPVVLELLDLRVALGRHDLVTPHAALDGRHTGEGR